jgi:hypothetical protein
MTPRSHIKWLEGVCRLEVVAMFVDVVRLSRLTESLSRFDYVDLVLGIPGPESGGISNTKYAKRLARLPLECTTSNTYHGDAM